MEIRRTRSADLPGLYDIFNRAIGGLFERHRFIPPAPSFEVFRAQQQHLLEHDPDRCVVAELEGRPAAFASAWVRDGDWYLASLFVDPSAQGAGVGSELLDAVWGEADLRRRTITDAIQPVSNALYARRGLIPVTPLLAFDGSPRADTTHELEAGRATADVLRELDLAAYGFDRALDHAWWSRVAECTVWSRSGAPVAYAYRFPGGTIGPLAGVDGRSAGDALTAELARVPAGEQVRVRMPGSARELVGSALAAGLRLAPTPGLLLVSSGLEPPTSLAIASYSLL